ncbi:hypothetical protein NQ315_009589 [Exocentrus adspersus]|uniref:CLIP domain-containing serine protease n=1 Tax=Exocentrus adspersus TaxID=1586481 RepID=A0AAV8WH09_9CUCU|nr:hypothetical protein NQ315_009589 [Exocentrus adspersus]
MFLKIVCGIQVLFYCIICVTSQGWAVDDDGCRTPEGEAGTCTLAKECGMMVAFLKAAPNPLPPSIKSKLSEYLCGYQGSKPKVCCSGRPIPVAITQLQTPVNDKDSDIDNHRNINLLPENCGYILGLDKISNGQNADLGEFPWMALLLYKARKGTTFGCGGTVISNRYILTAAHCITQLKTPLVGVRVGEYDISKTVDCETQGDGSTKCNGPVQDLSIEKIIPHPKFTKDYENQEGFNDIGLLRVARIKPAEHIIPICLPLGEVRHSKLTRVIVTGWGITETDRNRNSNIIQKIALPVINQQECQRAYKTITISNKQICANGRQQDTCNGDSGGALQTAKYLRGDTRMVQYGVISFGGAVCGSGTYPGLYTNVEAYMDWILNNIEP